MAEFEDLIKCLCTEEMMEEGTAKKVEVHSKVGYLVSYDAGLGFGFVAAAKYVGNNFEEELRPDEIKIIDKPDE